MTRLTLHIGAGKCGSSAIQTALTRRPCVMGAGGRPYVYAAISPEGAVRAGRQIVPGPRWPYVSTESLANLRALPPATLAAVRSRLLRAGGEPILSNESMLSAPGGCAEVLGRLGLPVRVIVYLRPQVEYLNSAWWQWGAWSPMARDAWIAQRIGRSQWHVFLQRWAAIPEVEEVVVRLLPEEVVGDFLGVLGVEPEEGDAQAPRVNGSLPATVLRLLQRDRALRERLGAGMDFRLPILLDGLGLAPTPWVIDAVLARRIVRSTAAGNRALLGMLAPPEAAGMRADPRWWDASAYAGKVVEPFEAPEARDPELEAVAARLLEAALAPASTPAPAPRLRARLRAVLDLRRSRG